MVLIVIIFSVLNIGIAFSKHMIQIHQYTGGSETRLQFEVCIFGSFVPQVSVFAELL
jgi:hypothetical protein